MPESDQPLKGQLLIARKGMRDPNFLSTVVLVAENGKEGSMGLVLNRPTSVGVAHALAGHFDLHHIDEVVYVGGPVELDALFILHNCAQFDSASAMVVPGVYLGSSEKVFERVMQAAADGDANLRFRVFCGCAGWAPGQLEAELDRGDWHLYPASAELVWHADPYEIWEQLLEKVYEKNRLLPFTVKNPEWN